MPWPSSPRRALALTAAAKRAGFAAALLVLALASNAYAKAFHYECSSGTELTARFSPPGAAKGTAKLTFATGRTITLPQAMSADGGRYASKDIEFWIKGQGATLTRGGTSETCSTR